MTDEEDQQFHQGMISAFRQAAKARPSPEEEMQRNERTLCGREAQSGICFDKEPSQSRGDKIKHTPQSEMRDLEAAACRWQILPKWIFACDIRSDCRSWEALMKKILL